MVGFNDRFNKIYSYRNISVFHEVRNTYYFQIGF